MAEGIDEGTITTGIDKFMHLLFERKKAPLETLSKELNISPSIIEYWAYVLESQGLVRINYTLTTVFLEWVG